MLSTLRAALTREQDAMRGELVELRTHVDSILAAIHDLHATTEDKGAAILEAPRVVLDEVVAAIAGRRAHHDIAISTDCHALPGARVDKHRALNILAELLGNALDALESAPVEHKRIRIHLQEAADAVVFQVVDNGIGIASEDLARIFRGGLGRPDGRGVNLHKSANSATSAGGSLTAESDGPGCGATFTLVLPNRGSAPVEPAVASSRQDPAGDRSDERTGRQRGEPGHDDLEHGLRDPEHRAGGDMRRRDRQPGARRHDHE
jgi:C4-dicarboxylate-specific signal transduction histidine kinase